MADRRPMLELLQADHWQEYEPEFQRLQNWVFYPLLLDTLEQLNHSVLFVSKMHGLGHIERTILQGGFCAMEEGLDRPDTELLLLACSYHDVGRRNDWVDDLHGHRSAQQIGAITGRTGEDLKLLQGAVDAHSRREPALRPTVEGYAPADLDRAIALAQLLKDADGLDRVRIGDLDPSYLRRTSSQKRAGLALEVFRRYQCSIGMAPEPFFTPEQVETFRRPKNDPNPPPPPPQG